jgi:hypothetical protein
MPKAKNFNAFTYGVGLELNASSFKSVKDTLKSDLDSLSKMVKAYNKMLEINPNIDLSEVIKEFKDMQTVIFQIKGSSNPFSEFVDKGLLNRISTLETSMEQMTSMSEKFSEQLSALMESVSSDIKGVGEFKFPKTFGQLFDDAEVAKKEKEIDTLKNKIIQLKQELDNLGALDSGIFDVFSADTTGENKKTFDEINQMLNDFDQLYKKIQSFDFSKGNILDIKPLVRQAAELGTKIQNAFSDYNFYDAFDEKFGENIILSFQNNFKQVQTCVQQEYQALENLIQQEEEKLASMRTEKSSSQGKTSVAQTIANIGKSNTEASGLTYTVNVIPKANASEWASVINRTIASVQDKLDPIYLKPTFSKNSKSMEKDVSGNLAQLSNTVKVNFSIVDNLDQSWDDVIDNIKSKIDNANRQLSQKAKIKVAFAKDENFQEDFKNSVYKVVNSIKDIKASIYITNGKKFLKDIEGIRTSAESKLKDIGANLAPIGLNFEVKNRDEILSNMDSLRAEIEGKVQNIGATIADLPKMMLQAMMYGAAGSAMGSAAAQNVVPNTSGNISASSQSANQQAASVGKMSERAKEAAKNIEKLQAQIDLLNNKGFKADKFVELGDFDNKIQPIKKSQKALKEMLDEYKLLEYRLSGSDTDIAARYTTEFGAKAFDEYKKDYQRKIELEQQLGNVVQNQIKYLEKKKQLNQEIINQSQTNNNGKNSVEEQTASLDSMSKRTKQAAENLTKINEQLASLKANGIDSSYFSKLGNFDENFKHIKGSNQEVRALLKEYSELQSKLSGTTSEAYSRYLAKYGKSNANIAINEDIARQKELESQLSQILQNQIGYLEHKAELSQEILNKAQKTVDVEENAQNGQSVGNEKESRASAQGHPTTQGATSFIAKIDNASLSDLAKDSTLRDISGKLDAIVGQLKTGIKINGKYEASSSSDSDTTGKKESSTAQEKQKAEAASASSKKESAQAAKQQLEVEQEITKEVVTRTALEQKENNNKQERNNDDYSSYDDDFYEQFQKWAQERAELEGYTVAKVKGILNKNNDLVGASIGFTKNGSQEGVVETFKLIEDKESGLKEFVRTSTEVTSNVQQYQKALDAAYVKQTALATSYTNQISSLKSALDPNAKNTLFGTEYEDEVNQKVEEISGLVQALHQIDENGNIKIFDAQALSDQKAAIELLLSDLKAYIKESQNAIGANNFNQKTDETAYSAKLKELEKTVKKIKLLQAQAEGKINTGENTQAEAQKKLAAEKENYEIIKNELAAFTQVYDAEKVAKAEAEARAEAEQKVADIIAKQKDAVLAAKENRINSTVNKAQSNYDLMLHQSDSAPMSDSSLSKLKEYKTLLDELKRQQESFNNDSSLFDDEKAINNFNKLSLKLKDVKKEYDALLSASIKFMSKIENASDLKTLDSSFNAKDVSQLKDAMQEFANSTSNGEATLISFNAAEKTATYQIKDTKGQLQELHIEYDKGTNSLGRYIGAVKEAQSGFQKFVGGLKGKFKGVLQYAMSFGSFYQTLSVIKKGIIYVKEIDTALTELKKVTDETDETYSRFLKTMSQTGAEVGATVSNLTNMAANWARLGYTIEQAGDLARSTAVLLNVSEFNDAESASEALISTIQAYGYAAEDSMHVVDVLNEIGNNFAVSSDGLATALQDSASALMSAGNDLEKSVAMVAAANKVLQDPNQVGSALRTISLRIRGTSTKVLEEMGEETDGVVESVSKLQAKVKGLSGVDILTDTGDYKDTYTIIKEIAEVWEQMSDIDQAALLELLAGKNRSNAMAAMLTNLDDLEGAYEDAMKAQGSAEAENEKYLNSIQGKVDLFNNAVQTMWMNFISSNAIKFVVDLGTKFAQLIDKVGVIKSALIALAAIKILPQLTKGFGLTNLVSDIFNLTNGLKDFVIGQNAANAATLSTAITTSLAESSLVKLAIQLGITTAEEVASASATTLLGFGFKALAASIWEAVAAAIAFLTTNPVGWAILAITAIAGLTAVICALTTSHKDYVEQLKDTSAEIKTLQSNIESLNSELNTTKSRIEELESKGPLTLTEQEELNKLKEQNAELERQIQLEEAREERARNKQAKAAKGAFETDDDFKPVDYGIKVGNKFDEKLGSVEKAKDKLNQAEVALQDAINSGMNTESNKFKRLEKNLESAQEDYADAQSDWDEFMKGKEEEYGDLEWFDGDNLTEAQKTVNEIISTMQNYSDRAEIMFGSAGAKESALNRLFGERGSEAGKAFQEAFNAKIESGEIKVDVDKFGDYSTAIDNATDSVKGLISENPQLKVQLDSLGISAEDVARYFLNISAAMQQTNETASVTITDIATLTSAYDSYASALQIVNDAIFDGQAISDDYYDSLKEYLGDVTVGEESFSDAIDTTNGKVVKNTRLLRALIAQKKKEQKATVSAAKAQSQLQYTKVVKQLQQAVKAMYLDYQAYGYVTKATYDNISAMRDQVQAIKNAIKEYAILELKLSDVTNAYDEFEDAKNRDAELAYGDSMIEMLKAISDGFLSGKVGSEEFKAACKALVPDSVIANCTTFEERLDAIDDYFENSKFADYFTIDEDGNFSIAIKNIEAFIADAKEAGAFIGNADGTFTLANSIKSVDDLANAMGITKAAAVAMLTELSKYDASWGDIVADITMTQLDKGIRDTTDALDQAIAKQEQFFKDGKDPSGANAEEYIAIQQEINNCSDALNTAQQAVVNNTKAWMEANDNVDTAKEKVATLTRELQELQEAGATDNEIQIKTNELENATKELYEALSVKYGLEEPTQMDFQLVLTDVQAQIDKWKEENATLVTEVVPKLAQDEDGVWKIPAEAEVELNEDDKQKIQTYLDLLNDKQQLELFTSEETDPIIDSVNQVNEVLNNILDAINSLKSDTDTSKVGNIVSSALGITGGSSAKSTNNSNWTSSTSKSSSITTATTTTTNNTTTPTSGTTGFDSEGVDQEIAAWNAMVDEWIANAQQSINEFGEGISTFFTETLPEYWNSFWASVGEKLSNVGEWAQGVGEDIGIFFTETLPQKWSEFWEAVGEWLDNVKTWASDVGEDIGEFFTETLPEKWSEFWSKVGEFITEIPYNVSYLITKVKMFFTETLPEKWDEFWDNVGEALDDLKEKAIALKDKVVEFFKVTIPQKWDEFWDAVGDGLNTLKENAIALKDKVVDFFTVTIPAEWNAFWDSVGAYINEVIVPALSSAWDKVYGFFTVTIPEKWNEFWTSVGTYIEEVIKPALSLAWEKVHDFFMVTIPEKWNEFWTGVGEFVTQTVPEAIETIKDGVTTFFTETVPGAINSLWESASSWITEKADSFWSFLKGEWIRGKEDAETGSYNPSGDSEALGNALAKGNAHSKKKPGLNTNEHNAIVGELGRELVVDPNKGVYYTVGEHGTQMVDLPKGAIIYNHKQTEELLKNGETSRGTYTGGLSFVKGNAHWDYGTHTKKTGTGAKAAWGDGSSKDWSQMGWDLSNALDSISDAAGDISDATGSVEDAADDAKQTIDFIEYRLEEIENAITRTTNRIANFLDDTSQTKDKNNLYEEIVNAEKQKASTYFSAAATYNKKAAQLLSEVPAEYQEMAKNGAIAIKDFIGENEGEIADAIEEYRTWSSKAEDAENNYLASIAEISAKRLEQLQDIADDFENIVGLTEQHANLIQAEMDLLDEAGERLSENFYKELMKDSKKQIEDLNNKRASLQDILDNAVKSGDVQVGSDDWYEMVNAIFDVDDAILECKNDIEGFQNSINDLYWDNLDKLIDRIDNVDSELSHLYNLVSDEEKVVDDAGNWTKDGVTALGLLAQQLEVANFKVEQYGEAIARLEKDYAAGLYSTDEYNEKLAELKENQWSAIEAQESAKKSIIDLNKTRIQAVKDGMQKEIDAYSELIDKKKEELNLQKESHDFSKQVAAQQKNIADIEKRLAVISGDNSASAIAQKKKLQAELAQAKEELEELYYDHSVEKQQDALDKQLEDYQNNKQDEMDALDESLKNEDQIIQDSYATIAANTESLAQNLSDIADKYGITLSDSVTKPWLDGVDAIGTYQGQLDTSMSAFTGQLKLLKQELIDLQIEADKTANSIINATNSNKDKTESARYTPPTPAQQPSPSPAPATPAPPSNGSSVTVKSSATHFSRDGGNGTRMQSWVPGSTFTVYQVSGDEVLIGRNGGYTGWVKLSDIEGYAKGSKAISKDQFAFLDELGEELQLVPDGAGRLSYVKKGTGIIPADLTERLMEWGQLDPSNVLEQSKPTVSAPHVINNNIELNLQVGEVVHIDHADNSSIPNIAKAVQDQMDNYMKNVNKKLYNRVR